MKCRAGKTLYWLQVSATEKASLTTYQQGSKLYSVLVMALRAKEDFERRGFRADLFETNTEWHPIMNGDI